MAPPTSRPLKFCDGVRNSMTRLDDPQARTPVVPVPELPDRASCTSTVWTLPSENAIRSVPWRRPELKPLLLADNVIALVAPAAIVPDDGLTVSQFCPSSVMAADENVTELVP